MLVIIQFCAKSLKRLTIVKLFLLLIIYLYNSEKRFNNFCSILLSEHRLVQTTRNNFFYYSLDIFNEWFHLFQFDSIPYVCTLSGDMNICLGSLWLIGRCILLNSFCIYCMLPIYLCAQ